MSLARFDLFLVPAKTFLKQVEPSSPIELVLEVLFLFRQPHIGADLLASA
jgi:hypothetical protein